MFPEIRRLLKQFTADKGELLSLNLKSSAVGTTFSTTELEFLRKYPGIMSALGNGFPAHSGETVNKDTAMTHTVVVGCYRLVTGTMGRIPANLMIEEKGAKRHATELPMYRGMRDEPNPEMSARGLKQMLTGHCMLAQDAFAKIVRRSGTGTALELQPLLPGQIEIEREKTGQRRLVYHVLNEFGGRSGSYPLDRSKPHEILHLRPLTWDGVIGLNMMAVGRQAIGTALAAERNVGRHWAHGGRKPAHLEVERNPFNTVDELKAYRADFDAIWSDPHKVPFVEPGMKLKAEGFTMAEAQALESRQWTVSDLCRLWGVSPHLVGDLSRATFSNIEQLFLEFKTITISDWANAWEQDWNRCVLTPEEKAKGYFLKHNLNAFLIGDFAARMAGYASAKQNGWLNADEIRDLEDRNPLPDGAGQAYSIQLNMQTVPGTGKPTVAEQALLDGKVKSLTFGNPDPATAAPKPNA